MHLWGHTLMPDKKAWLSIPTLFNILDVLSCWGQDSGIHVLLTFLCALVLSHVVKGRDQLQNRSHLPLHPMFSMAIGDVWLGQTHSMNPLRWFTLGTTSWLSCWYSKTLKIFYDILIVYCKRHLGAIVFQTGFFAQVASFHSSTWDVYIYI